MRRGASLPESVLAKLAAASSEKNEIDLREPVGMPIYLNVKMIVNGHSKKHSMRVMALMEKLVSLLMSY